MSDGSTVIPAQNSAPEGTALENLVAHSRDVTNKTVELFNESLVYQLQKVNNAQIDAVETQKLILNEVYTVHEKLRAQERAAKEKKHVHAGDAMTLAVINYSLDTILPYMERNLSCPFTLLREQHDLWTVELGKLQRSEGASVDGAQSPRHKKMSLKRMKTSKKDKLAPSAPEIGTRSARLERAVPALRDTVREMEMRIERMAAAVSALTDIEDRKKRRVLEAFAQFMMLDSSVVAQLDQAFVDKRNLPDSRFLLQIGEDALRMHINSLTFLQGYTLAVAERRFKRITNGADDWLMAAVGSELARNIIPPNWPLTRDNARQLDESEQRVEQIRIMRSAVKQMIGLLHVAYFLEDRDKLIKRLLERFV